MGNATEETLQALKDLATTGAGLKISGSITATDATAIGAFSTALEASHIVSATPVKLLSFAARLNSTAPTGTYYIQVWNLAAPPIDTTAVSSGNSLCAPIKIQHTNGSDDSVSLDCGHGVAASAGVSVVLSTTEFTKTISGNYLSVTLAETL